MSIVFHQLVSSIQDGEYRDVRYEFRDHLYPASAPVFKNKNIATGVDTETDMLAMIPALEERQSEVEVIKAIAAAETGISPDIVPDYQPQADYDRRALGQFMTLANVHHFNEGRILFLAMESRGGANANQRATYLGITSITYSEIDDRFSDLAGAQTFINDNKLQRWDDIPEEML